MDFQENKTPAQGASGVNKTPAHVAIIMDGNGRWAAAQGQQRAFGHVQGTESVRACIRAALTTGVKYLTLYTFSTENWGRPQEEIDALMELLCDSVVNEAPELQRQGVRVVMIGSRNGLSDKVRRHIDHIEEQTRAGDKLTVVLAINYSSRAEISHAASQIAVDAMAGKLSPIMITDEAVSERLYTAGVPDPDLVIRTGGEMRLSNFLLWQAAYAELYFSPVMWPDFGEAQFREALEDFARRDRRFGTITNYELRITN